MRCKNCDNTLRTDYSFCPDCGAKIIRNRLTMIGVMEDFRDRFLNIDNTLVRTITALFVKPEKVILDYIDGVRGKYLNPVSYITLSIAFTGIFYLIQRNLYPDLLDLDRLLAGGSSNNTAYDALMKENMEKFMSFTYDNLALFTFATIPFLALMSKLVFWKMKDLNYSEHFVLNTYAYSHASVITILIYFSTFWNEEIFLFAAVGVTLVMILYYMFVLKRVFDLSLIGIIARTLLFVAIGGALYVLIIVAFIAVIMFNPEVREMFQPAQEAALIALPHHFLV